MASGRKSIRDEAAVLRRFNDLAPKYFKVINAHLNSKIKSDRQWAVERLDKAFAKMIPQTLKGDGDDGELVFKIISYSAVGNPPTPQLPAKTVSNSATPSD